MDETDTLRRLLHATADEAGDWADPPSAVALAAQRRRRWRTVAGAGLAVVTVVAVAVPVAISTAHRHATASSLFGPTVSTPASKVLPGGRWTTLPRAPIIGRSPAATTWTGTQMLVWGGANGNTEYADGAAYNPATRTWTTLPKSPLSARSDATSVWTGTYWFVWGGGGPDVDRHPDGALYDPAARRWTLLPIPPVTDFSTVQAYWTGRQVLLLSVPGHDVNHLVLQAFDPSTQKWTRLPDLKLRPEHDGQEAGAVVAGSTFYVWSEWAHTVQDAPNGTETSFGIDGYSFDLNRQQWSPRHFDHPVDRWVRDPLWTGRDILIPPATRWCGFCAGPIDPHPTGALVDPHRRSVRTIASGPGEGEGGPYFWTGAVLLSGSSAPKYWTPTTGRWTALSRAPLAGYGAAAVWTGHSLLIWGQLSPAAHPSAKPTGAGIELSR